MSAINFEQIPIEDNDEPLVDLADYDFVLDNSYFQQGYSDNPKMYLRRGVADKLSEIQKTFSENLKFKIWDGHRPREVQNKIYQKFYNEIKSAHSDWTPEQIDDATQQFVTRATTMERIPPHSTGGAVDLTLVDGAGNELDMGTAFDYFGDEAASLYYEQNDIDRAVRNNRKLLRDSMIKLGFAPDDDEWWHFDYGTQLWALRVGAQKAIYGEAFI